MIGFCFAKKNCVKLVNQDFKFTRTGNEKETPVTRTRLWGGGRGGGVKRKKVLTEERKREEKQKKATSSGIDRGKAGKKEGPKLV